jgi:zinc protease
MRRLIPLWLVVTLARMATASADEPKISYQAFRLANGLQVYVIEAPLVYEVLWFKVGSKDEVANRTGFAHLFEHLMFKGSTHLPDGLMDRLLEAAGGYSNAFTSSDMTVYQNVASSNFLETMLWIDADRLAGLTDTLDKPKLDNQRDVVLNERRQSYENRPYGQSELLIQASLWPKDHGYHWSTIGEAADLRAAALPDVTAFFRTYYVPNNATMVIAGDVKPGDVRRLVEKYFAWIPKASEPARPRYKTPAPLTHEIVVSSTDVVAVPRVYLAWRGPVAFSAGEPSLALAATVLGGGKTSELYKRLVYDKQLAQDVRARFRAESIGGSFQIVATAKPGVDPQQLITEITDEIARLATVGPSPGELDEAKRLRESAFLYGIESTLSRAIQLAQYDAVAHDPAYLSADLARYRAVTSSQIKDAVTKYLTPKVRVVLTISPAKKPQEKP